MAFAEQLPRFRPGNSVPAKAGGSDPIVAGTFVVIHADKSTEGDYVIDTASAGAYAFGVAERTTGDKDLLPSHSLELRTNVSRRGSIARVLAGGGITAGQAVKVGSSGKAVYQNGSGVIVGYACNTVDTDDYCEVDLI